MKRRILQQPRQDNAAPHAQSSRVDGVKDKNIQYLEDLAARVMAHRRELSSIPVINPHVESALKDLKASYSNFSHATDAAIKDLKK